MHKDKAARRMVLATVGTLCSGALAGCSGSETTETEGGDNRDTTDSQGSDSDSSNPTDEESEISKEYPSEDPQSTAEEVIFNASGQTNFYSIKFDNLDYVNDTGATSEGEEDELAWSYKEALYAALNSETEGEVNSLWFMFDVDNTAKMSIVPNAEQQDTGIKKAASGYPEEIEDPSNNSYSLQEAAEKYTDFIRERLDGDGVVNHAGEIPEYAREALESGWQT